MQRWDRLASQFGEQLAEPNQKCYIVIDYQDDRGIGGGCHELEESSFKPRRVAPRAASTIRNSSWLDSMATPSLRRKRHRALKIVR
jgi:hypothetical protein